MRFPALCGLVAVTVLGQIVSASQARGQSSTTPRDSADSARKVNPASPARAKEPTLDSVRVVARRDRPGYGVTGPIRSTRVDTPLRDIPQAITVVTHQLIQDRSMQSMADVVRYVPGITMGQGEGNRDQPTIRGNSSSADFFVDGIRDDVQYYRDLYNLDRVEALKGSNAMLFGRGGGGGVLNRVTKEAQWSPIHELTLQGGSFDNKRVSADMGQALTPAVAARINGVYENSGLYRDGVTVKRYGINPTMTLMPGAQSTRITLGYEYFSDHRTADRGIPSFQGRPVNTGVGTFFGNPDINYVDASVNAASATVSHATPSGVNVTNRTRLASYDKFYQNVFPGAVDATGSLVTLSAYNHATPRRNLFNQTDVTYGLTTGSVQHTLLAGAEVGRQVTDNFRNSGYFNNITSTISAPISDPSNVTPVTFRQGATDADNHVTNSNASLYAQDQIALLPQLQLIGGVRYERFGIRYHNNRTDSTLRRDDRMVSPRFGLVYKPVEPLSFYASHSVSYLPSAGDQFSSLTNVTQALAPERFTNNEIGAKWDVADRLALTSALYRLDRTNTRAPDPKDPTVTVQTGSQRTNGFELGVSGNVTNAWSVAGGFVRQDAFVTNRTSSALAGARVALVPRSTISLWNKYQLARTLSLGLGVVHQADMYAAIDNTVTLPSYTEVDGAVYLILTRQLRAQLNVENLFDVRYYSSANGNNNITPGSPRAVRLALVSGF